MGMVLEIQTTARANHAKEVCGAQGAHSFLPIMSIPLFPLSPILSAPFASANGAIAMNVGQLFVSVEEVSFQKTIGSPSLTCTNQLETGGKKRRCVAFGYFVILGLGKCCQNIF